MRRLLVGSHGRNTLIGLAIDGADAEPVLVRELQSDPVTRAYYPADMGATIYSALGLDPSSQIVDRLRRPHQLNKGEVIAPLYGAG